MHTSAPNYLNHEREEQLEQKWKAEAISRLTEPREIKNKKWEKILHYPRVDSTGGIYMFSNINELNCLEAILRRYNRSL